MIDYTADLIFLCFFRAFFTDDQDKQIRKAWEDGLTNYKSEENKKKIEKLAEEMPGVDAKQIKSKIDTLNRWKKSVQHRASCSVEEEDACMDRPLKCSTAYAQFMKESMKGSSKYFNVCISVICKMCMHIFLL